MPRVLRCQQGADPLCAPAGDHLAVLPKNTHHITHDQLVRFGRHLGITPLSDVFDLELLEGSHEPVKPFPLPNTYEAVLSGEHCPPAVIAGTTLQQIGSKRLCIPSSADVALHCLCRVRRPLRDSIPGRPFIDSKGDGSSLVTQACAVSLQACDGL